MRVTQAEYARHRGVTRAAVNRRTVPAGGRIPLHGSRRLIDVDEADAIWEGTSTTRPIPPRVTPLEDAGGTAGDARDAADDPSVVMSTGLELARARAEVMTAEAQLRRLRLEERRGQLLDRAATLAAFGRVVRSLRDAWLAFPSRIGAELAADLRVDPAALAIALERYVRRQLAELSDAQLTLASGPPADDDDPGLLVNILRDDDARRAL